MKFWDDQRGQSLQLGMLFIGAILIVFIAGYQAQVVPQQTADAEADAYLTAQTDLIELRSTLLRTTITDTPTSVSVTTGASYPSRTIFRNPPPPQGRLSTETLGSYTITNATATRTETRDYWTGENKHFPARDIVFTPNYNEKETATPIRITSGVTYINNTNNHPVTDPVLVSGNQIQLLSLTGNISATDANHVSVDLEPSASNSRTITVTDSNDPISVFVPTLLSADHWRTTLLASEYDGTGNTSNDAYIDSITNHPSKQGVVLTFESDATYRLTITHLHLSSPSVNDAVTPSPTYLTRTDAPSRAIDRGEYTTLSTEVRDRFNQPRSNINVTYTIESGAENISFVTDPTIASDADGQATVTVKGMQNGTARIAATFGNGAAARTVKYTLTVDENSGTTGIPPTFSDVTITDQTQTTGGNPRVKYESTYTVSDPENRFRNVTLTVIDDRGRTVATKQSTALSDTFTFSDEPGGVGDEYTFSHRVHDSTGTTTDECRVSDTADGTDPTVAC